MKRYSHDRKEEEGGLNPSWIDSMLSVPLMDLYIKNDVIFTDTVRVLFFKSAESAHFQIL